MKFYLFLLCFFALGNLQAQDNPSPSAPDEYIIYFVDGTTTTEVTAIANTWCSSVISNLQPGGNVALLTFNCTFPFIDPYDPLNSIPDLITAVGTIKKKEPKVGGGSLNYVMGGTQSGIIGGNCYNEILLKDQTSNRSVVSVAIFDTGTNWDAANMLEFDFGTPHEMFGDATDKNGHGTHVASIVNKTYLESNAGNTTNYVDYMFGNPLDASGYGTLANMVLSMEYAILQEVNVINCSFVYFGENLTYGPVPPNVPVTPGTHYAEEDVLYLLMKSANPSKTLFVVAAGNDNFNMDGPADYNVYPASFPLDNILTVGSYSCNNTVSEFSNTGAQSVDIGAPGEDIVSIDDEMILVSYSGTSQATGYASGAATILGTYLPVFDAVKVKCAIMNAANVHPSFSGKWVSGGVLNIPRAVQELSSSCSDNSGTVHGNGLGTGVGGNTGGSVGTGENGGGSLGLGRIQNLNNNKSEVKIHPSPFTTNINVDFELQIESPVNISVYSLTGQQLYTEYHSGIKGSNEISVNLSHLPNTSYLLIRIETNEFTKTSKIIKVQ